MSVHTPSLFGAIVLVIVALILLELIGLGGLLLLLVAVVLLYWAFGPGSRSGRS
jgi:hypothetical protein